MAKEICNNSNVLASALLMSDEKQATRILDLLEQNDVYKLLEDKPAQQGAERQLNSLIASSILSWKQGWEIAKYKLINRMANVWNYTKRELTDMLDDIDNFANSVANDVEFRDRINQFGGWDIDEAIKQYQDYMAAERSLQEKFTIKDEAVQQYWKDLVEKTDKLEKITTVVNNKLKEFSDNNLINKKNAWNFVYSIWIKSWELKKELKTVEEKLKQSNPKWPRYKKYDKQKRQIEEQIEILWRYRDSIIKQFWVTKKSIAEVGAKTKTKASIDSMIRESERMVGDINNRFMKQTQDKWLVWALKDKKFKWKGTHYIAMREVLGDEKAYNNYVVARALLSEWDTQVQRILANLPLYTLGVGKLTKEVIQNVSNMEELISIAFSFWKELKDSDKLLDLFLEKKKEILATNDSTTKSSRKIQKIYIETLRNLSLYGENFRTHLWARLFTSRLQMLWYEIPKGLTDEQIYEWLAYGIALWKSIELGWVKFSKEDLDNIILLYAPAGMRYNDTAELIRYAWYGEYQRVLKDSKQSFAKVWDEVDQEAIEKKLFNSKALEKNIEEYKERLWNPSSSDRLPIILKLFTQRTIDPQKVLFIWKTERKYKISQESAKDMTNRMMAYDSMAKSNSILISSNKSKNPWIPCYENLQELKNAVWDDKVSEYLQQFDYVITDWNRFDAEDLYAFIDQINNVKTGTEEVVEWETKKKKNSIQIIGQGSGKFFWQGRFYMERWGRSKYGEWELRYSLINDEGMNDFFIKLNEMWIDIDFKVGEDMADFKERLWKYIDQTYWGDNAEETIKQLEDFLGVFPKRTKKPWKETLEVETDFYELERYIQQSLNTTWKYKIDRVDLREEWEKLPNTKEFYVNIAERRAGEVGLDFDRNSIWNLNIEEAKDWFFDTVYNNDIISWIEAKYNFLKMFWVTWVANESDKLLWIWYTFNKELKKQGMNMWVFQIDGFIDRLLKGEDIDDIMREDTWALWFIETNRGNPNFRAMGDSDVAFKTLIENVKQTIQFDELSQRLSYQAETELKKWAKHIPHDWEQFLFKMIEWKDADKYLEQLRTYWLYMQWSSKKVKGTFVNEQELINKIIDMYEQDMKNVHSYKEWLELKQRVQFILDTIEQKVIVPKYWDRLPVEAKTSLLWWKYQLPIDVENLNADYFKQDIEQLRKRYENLWNIVKKQVDAYNKKTPQQKLEELTRTKSVWVFDDNGWAVNITTEDMFQKYQEKLQWLDWSDWYEDGIINIMNITKEQFNQLPVDKQIAVITKLAILQKHMEYKSLYSKIYNRLYSWVRDVDFFVNYKLDENWYPQMFKTISQKRLPWAEWLDQQEVDELFKNVFDDIMDNFFTKWMKAKDTVDIWFDTNFWVPTLSDIKNLISERLDTYVKMVDWKPIQRLTEQEKIDLLESVAQYFSPYTSLQWLPKEITDLIDRAIFKKRDPFLEAIWINQEEVMNKYWDMKLKDWMTVEEMLSTWKGEENMAQYVRKSNRDRVLLSQLETEKNKADIEKDVAKVNECLNAYVNDYTEISEADKAMASDWMFGLLWTFKKYTSLNRIYETSEIMAGRWEVVATALEDTVFGWLSVSRLKNAYNTWKESGNFLWGIRWLWVEFWKEAMQSLRKATILFSLAWGTEKWFKKWVLDKIQWNYKKFYAMDYNDLMRLDASQIADNEERLALLLSQYFRQLGNELGSFDGRRWITTSMAENMALYNIWDCVLNLHSATSVMSIIGALSQWQFFRFFKFIDKGQAWYSEFFKMLWNSIEPKKLETFATQQWLLLHEWVNEQGVQLFNSMFWTNLDKETIDRISSALWGTNLQSIYNRYIWPILKTFGKSSTFNRMLLSYPWQLTTIWYQTIWYTARERALTRALNTSNKDIGRSWNLRKQLWILEWQYFELWTNEYQKVFLGDDDVYSKMYTMAWINYWDDASTVMTKLKRMMATADWKKLLDNTKDNANNIIDWFFARTMKDLSFMTALQHNKARNFVNVDELITYLRNNNIPKSDKDKVLRELNLVSARAFNNIMGLGWGWVFALKPKWSLWEFALDVYNLINFRWQWGTTILRQFTTRMLEVFKAWWYFMKNIWKPWIWDEIVDYFAHNIEFRNFCNSIVWDMYYAAKVAREYDRNEENEDWWDTMEDVMSALNFTSMYLQWLSSSWFGRMISWWIAQALFWYEQWHSLEDILWESKMKMWETFCRNFGRNFKVYDYELKVLRAYQEWGWDGMWQYIGNTFFDLSLGSLNYMSDEASYWNYNYNTTVKWPRSLIVWDSQNKENSFLSYQSTYDNYLLSKRSDEDVAIWDDKVSFSYLDILWNQSKLFKTVWDVIDIVNQARLKNSSDPADQMAYEQNKLNVRKFSELSDAMSNSKVMQQINETWLFELETAADRNKMFNAYTSTDMPWGSKFETDVLNWLNWAESSITYDTAREEFEYLMNKVGREKIENMMNEFHIYTNQKGVKAINQRAWLSEHMLNLVYELQDDPEFPYIYTLWAKWGNMLMYDAQIDKQYTADKYDKKNNPEWFWYGEKESWKSAYEDEFKKQFINANINDWAMMDYHTYLNKAREKMVKDDPETFKGFVNYYQDDEWEVHATLKQSYKKMAENQLWAIKNFQEWKPLEALADTSMLLKQIDYQDKSWITTLALMQESFKWIDNGEYTDTVKAYLKAKLWIENIQTIKKVEWYIETLWKDSRVVNTAYDVLYNMNDSLVDAISQVSQSLEVGNKQSKGNGKHSNALEKLKATKIELDKLTWWNYNRWSWRWRPSVNYPTINCQWADLLLQLNKAKTKSKPNNNLGIQKYTEVPLLSQPKTATPKKLKWEKKKVKNK